MLNNKIKLVNNAETILIETNAPVQLVKDIVEGVKWSIENDSEYILADDENHSVLINAIGSLGYDIDVVTNTSNVINF